jgi:cell division protein FtsQ
MARKIKRKKRSGRFVVVFVLLLLCVGGFFYFINSEFFTIQHIYVEATSNIDKDEVLEACGIQVGENLFQFNASDVQDSIKQIPIVKNASIVRIYPDTVKIIVTERIPYMVLNSNGVFYGIDETGKVISASNSLSDSSAMIVSGIDDIVLELGDTYDFLSNVYTQTAYNVLEFLTAQNLTDAVSELYISSDGYYYLYTNKPNVIKFYSWDVFESNEDFIKEFIEDEDRSIMVEVIEGCNPVYKNIEIP